MTKSDQLELNAFYAPTLLPAIEELLARGIDRNAIESLFGRSLFELRAPFMRIPLFLSRRFWAFALERSADRSFGLSAGRRFVSTATNGLTYLFDVAVSLESACVYFEQFFPFFNGHFRVQIVRHNGTVELRFVDCGSLNSSTSTTDYILVSICSMVRRKFLASGIERDPIIGIGLSRPPAADAPDYEKAFRARVKWTQSFDSIQLDPQLFVAALTPGNQELENTLVDLLIQTQLNSEPTLLEQVGDYLIEDLAGANWQLFCYRHHWLERTAARRLKALGWTFSELLEEYRRYRAEDLLQAGKLELVEISDRLGYGDVQSFSRACLRWFGKPPGMCRVSWVNPK